MKVAGGVGHTLVVKPDGSVWVFGLNNHSQLGDNGTTTRPVPQQVAGLSSIVAVAAGAYHSVALKSDGSLYAWGTTNTVSSATVRHKSSERRPSS